MSQINLKDYTLDNYPLKTYDKVRYRDTDKQGHVNNAVFTTFVETGRAEFLYHPSNPFITPGTSFVIASINLDLLSEIHWPGTVDIGTAIVKVGNSSIRMAHGLFQDGKLVATAETAIVHMDDVTNRPKPLDQEIKDILNQYILKK